MKKSGFLSILLIVLFATGVLAADITLTFPLGGEYTNDDPLEIAWTHDGGSGLDRVEIEFSEDDGATWDDIDTASAQDESYLWDTGALADGVEYRVRVTSAPDNQSEVSAAFTIDFTDPIADLDDETIDEGDGVTLDASGSDDATSPLVLFEWDVDGDGTFDEDTGDVDTLDLTWAELVAYGIDDNGVYDIGVRVSDAAGNTDTEVAELTVDNVGPEVTVTYPNGGEEVTGEVTLNLPHLK